MTDARFRKWPKIRSYRYAEETALHQGRQGETVRYVATTKVHGTNAAIGFAADGSVWFQSRNRVITPEDDNAGFAATMVEHVGAKAWETPAPHGLVMFGEWAGPGIMKKAAITEIDQKHFFVFGYVHGAAPELVILPHEAPITAYFEGTTPITGYGMHAFDVTFGKGLPENVQAICDEIEEQCPVAKEFGVDGPGEGLVCMPLDHELRLDTDLWFKVKGEAHHPKAVAPKPAKDISGAVAFARQHCTLERMEQQADGIERNKRNTGTFIQAVQADMRAELEVEMTDAGVDPGDVDRAVGKVAAPWWLGGCNG